MRPDTRAGHKRAEPSSQPRRWGPPGAHVRTPPSPQATHPDSAAPPQSGPQTCPRGTREPHGGSRAAPPAGVGQLSPPVPSGSVEARRGRVSPPSSPLSARPGRPRRGAHAPHRHRATSPEARPPRLRRPHQKATCQRLSEPRDDAAAAVAPASAAPPLPSWLRPEVTSAGRPPPRHRPEAELVARDPSGPRRGSAA